MGIRMSVSTLKAGALDFLEKPYDPQRLLDAVQAGVEKARLRFTDHVLRESVRIKVSSLTPRERQILALVVEGLPSQNIARKLGMSVKTVDVHRARSLFGFEAKVGLEEGLQRTIAWWRSQR